MKQQAEREQAEKEGAHTKKLKTRPLTAKERKTAAAHCERSFFCVWKGTKIKGTPDRSYRGDMEEPPPAAATSS